MLPASEVVAAVAVGDNSAVVRAQSHAIGGIGQILDDSYQRQDSFADKPRTAAGRNGETLAVMSGPGTASDWTTPILCGYFFVPK